MNEHATWIECLLLNELQSDDEVLTELGADAPEILESARKTTAALNWLRSLQDQQVVRVPKVRDLEVTLTSEVSEAIAFYKAAIVELNPGAKMVEV